MYAERDYASKRQLHSYILYFFLLRQNSIRIFVIIKMKKFKKSLFFIFSYFWEEYDILYWTIDYRRDVYVVESLQL